MAETGAVAGGPTPQLVRDAQMIVRDLYFERLADTLRPIDESTRRILETCLPRGLLCADASPEGRVFAASRGISA